VIPQHELLRIRMELHLQVYPTLRWAPPQGTGTGKHPVGRRISVQVMLEPVRSYVRGTIRGTSPWR
jgi:hypothetical protein